jgi:hypothetical protein
MGKQIEPAPARQEHTCLRCGHRWFSKLARPAACPKCMSATWDRDDLHGAQRPARSAS